MHVKSSYNTSKPFFSCIMRRIEFIDSIIRCVSFCYSLPKCFRFPPKKMFVSSAVRGKIISGCCLSNDCRIECMSFFSFDTCCFSSTSIGFNNFCLNASIKQYEHDMSKSENTSIVLDFYLNEQYKY